MRAALASCPFDVCPPHAPDTRTLSCRMEQRPSQWDRSRSVASAAGRGRRPRPRRPASPRARTSAGARTPPAARTRAPAAAAAATSSRSGPASVPSRSIAVTSTRRPGTWSSASAKEIPADSVQPAARTWPSRTSSARTSASPSSNQGVGSGQAAVPTITRSAPASSSARASSRVRMPPEAWTGSPTGGHVAHELGPHPARAGAVEVDQVDPAGRRRPPSGGRAPPGRPRARRRRRSRPGGAARPRRRARRRRGSPRSVPRTTV